MVLELRQEALSGGLAGVLRALTVARLQLVDRALGALSVEGRQLNYESAGRL